MIHQTFGHANMSSDHMEPFLSGPIDWVRIKMNGALGICGQPLAHRK